MTTQASPSLSSFLAIKYWPTWLGLGLLWAVAFMPFSWRMGIGRSLGLLTFYVAKDRRYITHVNITLCFPELSVKDQINLTKASFIENGIGLIESVSSWARDVEHFRKRVRFIGIEKVEAALAQGRGLVILGAHFSTLDLGGALLSLRLPFAATYRPHNNLLFDRFIYQGRLRTCTPLDRNNVRAAFKHLKMGKVLWYAPDQDYGRSEHCVFAPFFGQPASTITAAARFAKINNSPTFIIRHHRIDNTNSYEVELTPIEEAYPTGDDYRDASLINSKLEAVIRRYPAQYLWMHKRFKTQIGGKPDSPYINIKTSSRKLSSDAYKQLCKDIENDNLPSSPTNVIRLKVFKGVPGKLNGSRHIAKVYDRNAKLLRSKGLGSVTVNNLFIVKSLNLTSASTFSVTGPSLDTLINLTDNKLPYQQLAEFFAKLHHHGFLLSKVIPEKIILAVKGFSILNPEDIIIRPSSIAFIECCNNLLNLFQQCNFTSSQAQTICQLYCDYNKKHHGLRQQSEFMQMLATLPDLHIENRKF